MNVRSTITWKSPTFLGLCDSLNPDFQRNFQTERFTGHMPLALQNLYPIMLSLRKHPFLLALRRWERFRAKRPQRRRARRNGCFRRLHYAIYSVEPAEAILSTFWQI